jgi:hypothetical protein
MAVLAVAAQSTQAFAPSAAGLAGVKSSMPNFSPLFAEEESSAFVPAEAPAEEQTKEEIGLEIVEMLGKGAAKVCVSFVFPPRIICLL